MLNMETLSKPELLTLFSILEGELEARDLVIDALKVNTATLAVVNVFTVHIIILDPSWGTES